MYRSETIAYDCDHMTSLPPELAQLLPTDLHELCEARHYARQATLFQLGQRPEMMFYVVQGEVLLERMGMSGEPVIVQRTDRGFVSEASLQASHYHCDAQVVMATDVVCVPVAPLLAQLLKDAAFALRWIGMCNREIRRLRLQCERLSIKTVQGRLMHLIETRGSNGHYSVGADLKTLASELGVTHEALYRTLAALEKAGRLERGGGQLSLIQKSYNEK